MYLVYNPDGIVLVRRYCITCLNRSWKASWFWGTPPRRAERREEPFAECDITGLCLEGKMLDLRIGI